MTGRSPSTSRVVLPLLCAGALLLPSLALTGTRPAKPFSRSRWIAERRDHNRFDGGALPARRDAILRFLDKVGPVEAAPGKAVERSVRVSRDILDVAPAGSEPETETETFFAVDPKSDRHLLAGYQEGRFFDGGARALTWAVSTDAGKTWREGIVPNLTQADGGPYERASDPWVALGLDNRAYYASIAFNARSPENGVYLSASSDGGRSWGDPVAVHTSRLDFDDKESVVVDSRPDSPFHGRVYVAWDTVGNNGSQHPFVASSDDFGQTFSPPVAVTTQGINIGIIPLVGPGGRLNVVWGRAADFSGSRFTLFSSHSEDGGATFSAPVAIADTHAVGVEGQRTGEELPSTAIDPTNGDLYVVWGDSRFTPGVDQAVLSRSTNGGESWTSPLRVSDGPADAPAFTPAVAVDANGRIGVCYYSLRNDPRRLTLVDQYCNFVRKRGAAFGPGKRINAASWDVRLAAVADGGFFLGDYQGVVPGTRGFSPLFVATIQPSRRDPKVKQPDAYTRLMPP
jgi:hypothetical protein